MDRTSKKILKSLKSMDGYNYIWLDVSFPNEYFDNENEFFNSVKYLCANGYADYISSDGIHIGIHLTHEGIHKKEFERQQFWHLFFTNFLPGFVSGIVSTVIGGVLLAYILSRMGIG